MLSKEGRRSENEIKNSNEEKVVELNLGICYGA